MEKLKVGLALGGGGARGLSHIGVLRVLVEEGIPIDIITGTSMGAIVGAMYAVNPKINEIFDKIKKCIENGAFNTLMNELNREKDREGLLYKFTGFIKRAYINNIIKVRMGVLPRERVEDVINELLPEKNIEDLTIPFAVVATNLYKGEEAIISKGPLRRAVLASASIPGILPPIEWDGELFSDGGSISECPINACKSLGADIVIAVNVKSRKRRIMKLDNGLEVLSRANYLTGVKLNEFNLEQTDILINPSVGNVHWANFKKMDYCVKHGERAVWAKLEAIKNLIKERRIKSFIKRIFTRLRRKPS